ncbi:GNAT family N-acetyltransferase [Convivina praedatoris]|uniref:Protein ElaA n=1 Tax=Convivina praedatoris TaxID=2880963 RepID=A0ABN8HAQ1_9LACO|nr:GNAT family N-acetyltransferase [Convivina sp. LMG 32447]CAH1855924.1 Protein ElaA [Convivina sp. LMG 32447]CAH1856562.1 Protein ElaA [Convivina sp. LMG 32447]CAH1856917.1 Protein ElaA [Convivina sp. LMG 32447]
MWKIKKMAELTAEEFYQILKLRIDTFVVAQQRIYHELDDNDPQASHVFYQAEDVNQVNAYARVFIEDDHITFGRVVTSPATRGSGLGAKLVKQILQLCSQQWPGKTIEIEAQEQVVGFYEKFNFISEGEPFIFESTPHVTMIWQNKINDPLHG